MRSNYMARASRTRRSLVDLRTLFAAAALLPALTAPWSGAQGQRRQRSAFPHACTHLPAQMRATANGPDDELRFDTLRIQKALDDCPPGQAVELEAEDTGLQRENAFLVAPLRVPAGVTLLIDAGITVYASLRGEDYRDPSAVVSTNLPCGSLPCRALIRAEGSSGVFAASVSGFGTLDGRGSTPLFDLGASNLSWADLPSTQRPHLIDAAGNFELHKLTVRNAAATALHLTGRGAATVEGAKFIAATNTADTRSIAVAS